MLHPDSGGRRHGILDGNDDHESWVRIRAVDGCEATTDDARQRFGACINGESSASTSKPLRVTKVHSPTELSVGDLSGLSAYIDGGILEPVRRAAADAATMYCTCTDTRTHTNNR